MSDRPNNTAILGKYRHYCIRRGYVRDILHKPVVPNALGDLWDEAFEAGRRAERNQSGDMFYCEKHGHEQTVPCPDCAKENA